MVFRHRLRLLEVPVEMRERGGGRSSITALRSIYYMVKVLLAIFVGLFRRDVVPQGGIRMTPLAVSIAGAIASFMLVLVVLELIRSRRLRERYALLWLVTGIALTVLSAWRDGLNTIAGWLGVRSYPPAVLFAVGILFILAVLLHYSTVISRLSDQNVVLAQRLALLEQEYALAHEVVDDVVGVVGAQQRLATLDHSSTRYSGRCFVSSKIRAMYWPTMPIPSS